MESNFDKKFCHSHKSTYFSDVCPKCQYECNDYSDRLRAWNFTEQGGVLDHYDKFCMKHDIHYNGLYCKKCEEQRVSHDAQMQADNETVSQWIRNLIDSAKAIQQPVSLGRFEEQTDHDREFLQACGISVE